MMTAIDENDYTRILSVARPHVIRTPEENATAIGEIEQILASGPDLSPAQSELLALWLVLVERFEDEHFRLPTSSPTEALAELIDVRNLKQRDIAHLFSSRSNLSEILAGKRNITKDQAKRLAEFFKVPVTLFI